MKMLTRQVVANPDYPVLFGFVIAVVVSDLPHLSLFFPSLTEGYYRPEKSGERS